MSLVFHLLLLVLLPVAWWWWWCSPRLPADPILWGRKAAATAAWALKYAIREAAIMWWWSALNGVEVYKDGVTAETAAPLCLSRSELLLRPSSSWIANGDRWGSVCEELVVLLRLSAPGALTWIVVSGRGMVAVSRFIIRKLATGVVCGFFSFSLFTSWMGCLFFTLQTHDFTRGWGRNRDECTCMEQRFCFNANSNSFHDTHGLLITHCFPLRQFYTWTPFLVVIAHVFIQPVPTANLGNYNFPSRNNFLL